MMNAKFETFTILFVLILLLFIYLMNYLKEQTIREFFQNNLPKVRTINGNLLPSNEVELNRYSTPLPADAGCIVRGDGKTYCDLHEINNTGDTTLQFILDKVKHLCGIGMLFKC